MQKEWENFFYQNWIEYILQYIVTFRELELASYKPDKFFGRLGVKSFEALKFL